MSDSEIINEALEQAEAGNTGAAQRMLGNLVEQARECEPPDLSDAYELAATLIEQSLNSEQPDVADALMLLREAAGEEPSGAAAIMRERIRQVSAEGWSADHDDRHDEEEIAWAAVCYAVPALQQVYRMHCVEPKTDCLQPPDVEFCDPWPWAAEWDKRKRVPTQDQRIRDLVKAGALCAAEVDRLRRLKITRQRESNERTEAQRILDAEDGVADLPF